MELVLVPAAPLPVVRPPVLRRPSRPLVLAVPYAAWLCVLGAPSAILAR